jgi:hypothetical protein
VEWTDLAHDRHRSLVLVNMVMDFGFHKRREKYLLAERAVSFSRMTLLYGSNCWTVIMLAEVAQDTWP